MNKVIPILPYRRPCRTIGYCFAQLCSVSSYTQSGG